MFLQVHFIFHLLLRILIETNFNRNEINNITQLLNQMNLKKV